MYVENLEMHNSLKWVLFIKVSGQITSDTLAMEGNLAINSNTCQMLAFTDFLCQTFWAICKAISIKPL